MDFLKKIFSIIFFKNHMVITILGIKISLKMFDKNGAVLKETNLLENYKRNFIIQEKVKQRVAKNNKCRVAFYVFEISKWKTDSLYKLLKLDNRFEPFIVLGMTPGRTKFYTEEELEHRFKKQIQYFQSKGIKVFIGYDIKNHKQIPLKKFNPDIVFYQQHVGNCSENDVQMVNKYALTAYVPYNVPNYLNTKYDYNIFCSHLWRFYTLNETLKNYYTEIINNSIKNIVATGHTALDYFYLNHNIETDNKYVIYAPHFSIMHPAVKTEFYYSTFNLYGDLILEFAKKHPEIQWVFKPHPNLRESLKKMRIPQECIEAYYNDWAQIGVVCENADYQDLFLNSKAMITDCGSFLTEYFCTGKPLLHLIQPISINWPGAIMRPMFNCFYKVYNNNDLLSELERVIVRGDDYKKQERLSILNQLDFANQYAAENIKKDICTALF